MFDVNGTLCVRDIEELESMAMDLLGVRGRIQRFVSSNPQLSWSDVHFLSEFDRLVENANSYGVRLTSLLRNRAFDRAMEADKVYNRQSVREEVE